MPPLPPGRGVSLFLAIFLSLIGIRFGCRTFKTQHLPYLPAPYSVNNFIRSQKDITSIRLPAPPPPVPKAPCIPGEQSYFSVSSRDSPELMLLLKRRFISYLPNPTPQLLLPLYANHHLVHGCGLPFPFSHYLVSLKNYDAFTHSVSCTSSSQHPASNLIFF